MTQYRVKLSVTQEMLVDVMADASEDATQVARNPLLGERKFVTVLEVHSVAGQQENLETDYVPVSEPMVEGAA